MTFFEDVAMRTRLATQGMILLVGAATGIAWSRCVDQPAQVMAQDSKGGGAEERVRKLKLQLPKPTKPTNTLVSAVRVGDLLYVSGMGPVRPGGGVWTGRVSSDRDVKMGRDAARQVGLQMLGVLRDELGSLDKVVRLVKTFGMVNAAPEFTQHPYVINGFSDLMVEVFGEEAGKGARSAVGMSSLPGGIPVEVEAIFQVRN